MHRLDIKPVLGLRLIGRALKHDEKEDHGRDNHHDRRRNQECFLIHFIIINGEEGSDDHEQERDEPHYPHEIFSFYRLHFKQLLLLVGVIIVKQLFHILLAGFNILDRHIPNEKTYQGNNQYAWQNFNHRI